MTKQEYRLEFYRIDAVNMKARQIGREDFWSSDDIDTAKGDADILAKHYDSKVKWHDWQDGIQHPTMRFNCYVREVDLNSISGAVAEFIVLYPVYPFSIKGKRQTYECP